MKYLKYFEEIKNEPQLYDYVIVNGDCMTKVPPSFNKFINENIGKIIKIDNFNRFDPNLDFYFLQNVATIKYENYPSKIRLWFDTLNGDSVITVPITEIIHFSSNINDLDMIIKANKYNI